SPQRAQSDIPGGTTPPQEQRRDFARASAPVGRRRAGASSWNNATASAVECLGPGALGASSINKGRSNVSRRSPAATGRSRSLGSRTGAPIVDEDWPASATPGADDGGRVAGVPAWNFVPHFGHFSRLPAADSGRLSTTRQLELGHWVVSVMFRWPGPGPAG